MASESASVETEYPESDGVPTGESELHRNGIVRLSRLKSEELQTRLFLQDRNLVIADPTRNPACHTAQEAAAAAYEKVRQRVIAQ